MNINCPNTYNIKRASAWNDSHFQRVLETAEYFGREICGSPCTRNISGSNIYNGVCSNIPVSANGRCRLHGGLSSGTKTTNNSRFNAIKTGLFSVKFKDTFMECNACPLYRNKRCEYGQPDSVCQIEQNLFSRKYNEDVTEISRSVQINNSIKLLISKITLISVISSRIAHITHHKSVAVKSLIEINRAAFSKEQKLLNLLKQNLSENRLEN